MKRKESPIRGEVLFRAVVAAERPHEASFVLTIFSRGADSCLVVMARERVHSQFTTPRPNCDRFIEAVGNISIPPSPVVQREGRGRG